MKKKLYILVFVCIFLFICSGCTKESRYGIEWIGWEMNTENPVINEPVCLHVKYGLSSRSQMTVLFHWIITEGSHEVGQTQKTYTTVGNEIIVNFDTPGKKNVVVWADSPNYDGFFKGTPLSFTFEVSESEI